MTDDVEQADDESSSNDSLSPPDLQGRHLATEDPESGRDEALETQDPDVDRQDAEEAHPAVDELEARLRDVDAAMELLQAGELDAAERAIEALESRVGRGSTRY